MAHRHNMAPVEIHVGVVRQNEPAFHVGFLALVLANFFSLE